MDLTLTEDDERLFRDELRAWLADNDPGEMPAGEPKHQGLTYFLMDMDQDGVQVRPLRQMTGNAEFNEIVAERSSARRRRVRNGRYDGALWQEMAGLGWPGIAVSEEHGGQGFGAVELALVLEEAGGFGFTWDADIHWLYKRAHLDAALLGGARHHRAALARYGAARAADPVRM